LDRTPAEFGKEYYSRARSVSIAMDRPPDITAIIPSEVFILFYMYIG
jgi:hypothetical protein